MHRHIDTDEVIDSASGVGKRKVKFSKDEDIEYRDGVLRRSSGRAEVKMAKEVLIQQEGRVHIHAASQESKHLHKL